MIGFDTLSNEIVSEVSKSSLVGSVYAYASPTLDKYPAVVITPSSLSGAFADSSRTLDSFVFSILILCDRHGIESTVESTMQNVADDLLSRLSNNAVINNNQNTFGKPLSMQWGYGTAPEPDMRILTITYQIEVGQ